MKITGIFTSWECCENYTSESVPAFAVIMAPPGLLSQLLSFTPPPARLPLGPWFLCSFLFYTQIMPALPIPSLGEASRVTRAHAKFAALSWPGIQFLANVPHSCPKAMVSVMSPALWPPTGLLAYIQPLGLPEQRSTNLMA